MKSRAADNNREEDARHLYISFSLHYVRPRPRRFTTFIAGDHNDFFLLNVMRRQRSIGEKVFSGTSNRLIYLLHMEMKKRVSLSRKKGMIC